MSATANDLESYCLDMKRRSGFNPLASAVMSGESAKLHHCSCARVKLAVFESYFKMNFRPEQQ